MANHTKNQPPKALLTIGIIIILMVIAYLILTFIFPTLFSEMNTGEIAPVNN